jgi:hypothetical protein
MVMVLLLLLLWQLVAVQPECSFRGHVEMCLRGRGMPVII